MIFNRCFVLCHTERALVEMSTLAWKVSHMEAVWWKPLSRCLHLWVRVVREAEKKRLQEIGYKLGTEGINDIQPIMFHFLFFLLPRDQRLDVCLI